MGEWMCRSTFCTSALAGVSGQLHIQAALSPGNHLIEGWVSPIAGVKDVAKRKLLTLPGYELLPFGRAARSQSPNVCAIDEFEKKNQTE
jgi:hypothetical protein